MQTTTFWMLAKTFIHTIYILQSEQPVHRLKIKPLISRCSNETTQTTIDTTLTTTFWILAKTLMHTIYNLQCQQPVHRFKTKTVISLCTNETTQTTIFSIDNENVLNKRQPIQSVFQNNIDKFIYFPQLRHLQLVLFRLSDT